MHEARKFEQEEPGFMALKEVLKGVTGGQVHKQKKHWFNTTVLITWIVVIMIIIIFWMAIIKLL